MMDYCRNKAALLNFSGVVRKLSRSLELSLKHEDQKIPMRLKSNLPKSIRKLSVSVICGPDGGWKIADDKLQRMKKWG